MKQEPIELYLKELEDYREGVGLSRPGMADELGISRETYYNWYRKTENQTRPSSRYARWIKSFLEERGIISAARFLEKDGPNLLQKIGFREGQTVVDFGSGNGDYSLILSRVVGPQGTVYPVDKDIDVLGELMGRVRGNELENIETRPISTDEETPKEMPFSYESIDAIWASDVLHDGYFEEDEEKNQLLQQAYQTLKPKGFIAVHPVHMDEDRLKEVIKSVGFHLEQEYYETVLFHGDEFHKGSIFKFRRD